MLGMSVKNKNTNFNILIDKKNIIFSVLKYAFFYNLITSFRKELYIYIYMWESSNNYRKLSTYVIDGPCNLVYINVDQVLYHFKDSTTVCIPQLELYV